MRKLYTILIFTLTIIFNTTAQNHELGIFYGTAFYTGDFSYFSKAYNPEILSEAKGLWYRRKMTEHLAVQLGFQSFELKCEDSFRPGAHGMRIRTRINEVSMGIHYNFLQWRPFDKGPIVKPYLFAGLGLFTYNPKGWYESRWVELSPLGTEGQGSNGKKPYQRYDFNIPVGLGIQIQLSSNISLGLEFNTRTLFTDYIDDTSGATVRVDEIERTNGKIAAHFASLGNPEPTEKTVQRGGQANDGYHTFGITMGYTFTKGRGRKCFRF